VIKIIIISINFALSMVLIASISWFEQENLKIENINKKQSEDILKLKKIGEINLWLDSIDKSMYKVIEKDSDRADENLLKFYGTHEKNYNLVIKRFIYEDSISKNMNMLYSVNRENLKDISGLVSLDYDSGFVQFRELNINKTTITGEIQLIQLYNGEYNAPK